MLGSKGGVLPRQELLKLMSTGFIAGVSSDYVNPASIDLPLSDEAYRLEGSFLPGKGEHVRTWIDRAGGERHDLTSPLEQGVCYLIRIAGTWTLPSSVYAYANPKSSTGRLNVLSRVVADNVDKYDALTPGWGKDSEMWLLVRADSFPVRVYPGIALSQLRFFTGKSFLSTYDMEVASKKDGLLFDPEGKKIPFKNIDVWNDAIVLTLQVGPDFGSECRGSAKPLCLKNRGRRDNYFKPIQPEKDLFLLRKGGFYIVSTKERIMVPPYLSAELRPIDYRFGAIEVHRAGYIDPGWGYGSDGSVCGRTITLEVTPHEDLYVKDGQAIARLRYEHMYAEPDVPYDSAASNYIEQNGGAVHSKYLV